MDDARWMQSALALARRAVGLTWPNPAVGCVIVRDGRVLGRATTAPGGRPHAETEALRLATPMGTQGATAYVTLEPCAHHGKTPPCTSALIQAGIQRVVCAMQDPDPRVAGRGFETLRAAGIDVEIGLMSQVARRINAGFLSRVERGRPLIQLKLATTLDGRIATKTGESRWITGPLSRRRVHLMRAVSDAVLVGGGTARTDNPMLDVRGLGLEGRKPVRIVADSGLSIQLTSRLIETAQDHPVWILHRADAPTDRAKAMRDLGVELLEIADVDGILSMTDAATQLADRGLTRILCEGGGRIAASLLKDGLVDDLAVFSAGKTLGADGHPAVQAFGLEHLADAPAFELDRVEQVGGDTLSWWHPVLAA